jgi:hypothetical protein
MATQSLVASVPIEDKEGAKAATMASQSLVASVPVAGKGSAEAVTAVVISQPDSWLPVCLSLCKIRHVSCFLLLSSRYSFIEMKEINEMQSAAAKEVYIDRCDGECCL